MKGKRHGPIVQGYSNLVELDFKENTYYIGNLYAGSDHILTKVIFDTRTKWTGIILDNAENAPNPSDYQLEASGSQVPYLPNNQPERVKLKQDMDRLYGNVYRDEFCLR